jgi:ERCC4-type nuclease
LLIVDSREPQSIIDVLKSKAGAEVHTIETGDYVFDTQDGRRVMIERKAINDLLGSLNSGRLHAQVGRLLEEADVPMLLLEGHMYCTRGGRVSDGKRTSGWSYTAVQNILVSLQIAGLYVVQSASTARTPHTIIALYHYFQKKKHELLRTRQAPLAPPGPYEARLGTLSTLPGVADETAGKLLDLLGSLEGVFTASETDLMRVRGIGHSKAQAIRQYLTEKVADEQHTSGTDH